MPTVIQGLLGSKKFVFTALVSAVVFVGGKYGLMDQATVYQILTYLLPGYVVAQGLADWGKHAATVDAASSAATNAARTEALREGVNAFGSYLAAAAKVGAPESVASPPPPTKQ